jgi:ribonuclease D
MTTLITSASDLMAACTQSACEPFIAIDTEFMRDKTYYPRLCLIQMATATHDFLIDPLSEEMDLSPFFDLMRAEHVTKVFHAARQDIEILWQKGRVIPQPLFDTQVAAMMCGYGGSISYEQLVKKCLNIPINKTLRFTDWGHRPLSDEHKAYATADVRHLHALYGVMKEQLQTRGRQDWFEDQQRVLLTSKTYENTPEDAWMRLRSRVRTPRARALLMAVAAWREQWAQQHDMPRQHVMRDEQLIALITAAEQEALEGLLLGRFVRRSLESVDLSSLHNALQRGLSQDEDLIPGTAHEDKHRLVVTPSLEMLKLLLKSIAEEENIPAYTLGSTEDLADFLSADNEAETALLSGWRGHIIGQKAKALKKGEGALIIRDGRVIFMPLSENDSSVV